MDTDNLKASKKDVAEIIAVAEKIADHTNQFEAKILEKTDMIENRVSAVEKEVSGLLKNV